VTEEFPPQSETLITPEISPLQEAEQRLAALVRPDPNETVGLRAQQAADIDQAVAEARTAEEAQAIRTVGDLYLWGNFGAHQEPLPPGILYVNGPYERRSIQQDISQFSTYHSFTRAVVALKEAQGRAALGLIQIFDRKKGAILEAAETALKTTAWYGFLESFDTERRTAPEERALTHSEQLQRWAASHQEVIRATGIDPFDAAMLGKPPKESDVQGNAQFDAELDIFTAERFGLRKSFARTELATTHDPIATPKDDAWERARDYFLETAAEVLVDYPSIYIEIPADRTERSELLREATMADLDDSVRDRWLLRDAGRAVSEALYLRLGNDGVLKKYYQEFFVYTIGVILSKKDLDSKIGFSVSHMTYGEMLASMTRTFARDMYNDLENEHGISKVLTTIASSRAYAQPHFNFINDPQQITWTEFEEIEEKTKAITTSTRADLVPAKSIIELSGRAIGQIVRRTEEKKPWRLLMEDNGPHETPLGQLTGNEPLIIELGEPYGKALRPHVPGYELVSQSNTWFGFKLAIHNPYDIDEVMFSEGMRSAVAEAIARAKLPLPRLVEGLQDPEFTMKDLEYALEAASRYKIPRHQKAGADSVERLADFNAFFRRRKFDTQCLRNAHFGKLILAAGAIESEVITGYLLPKGTNVTITELRHAQLRTWYDGLSYIIDATPVGGSFWQDNMTRAGRALARSEGYTPPIVAKEPVATVRQRIRTELERTIADTLGRPVDEALYGSIAALGGTHPLFKSWSLAVRATNYNDIDHQELLEHIDYLAFLEADIRENPRLLPPEEVAQLSHYERLQRIMGELLATADPFA
jgi:hypothetical protein